MILFMELLCLKKPGIWSSIFRDFCMFYSILLFAIYMICALKPNLYNLIDLNVRMGFNISILLIVTAIAIICNVITGASVKEGSK